MANVEGGTKGFVRIPLATRFWSKVEKTPGCWLWRGSTTSRGYGQLYRDGKLAPAHRIAYELSHGSIDALLVIDHLCRNPLCVNPAHLEPVTQAENCRRGDHKTNSANAHKSCCKRGHPFNQDNIYWQGTRRQCRQCRAARDKARKVRAALKKAGVENA